MKGLFKKRTKICKILRGTIIASVLIIALISCTSTPNRTKIAPPDPIDANGNSIVTYDPITNSVTMPYLYWEQLVNYIMATQAIFTD